MQKSKNLTKFGGITLFTEISADQYQLIYPLECPKSLFNYHDVFEKFNLSST